VAGHTPITPDTALRLAKYFRTTPQFWMNLQTSYDLKVEVAATADELSRIEEIKAA
jgi:addiction module HigA family antidote